MNNNKIEFTIFLFNKNMEDDLGIDLGEAGEIEAKMKIRVDMVGNINQTCRNDSNVVYKDRCNVNTIYGDSYHVLGSYESVLNKLESLGW